MCPTTDLKNPGLYLSSVLTDDGLSLCGLVYGETPCDAEQNTRKFLEENHGRLLDVCCIFQKSEDFTKTGGSRRYDFIIGPDAPYTSPRSVTVNDIDGQELRFGFDERTRLGEPRAEIPLSDGTFMEIVHETNNLGNRFYSVRRRCVLPEKDSPPAKNFSGIIATWTASDHEKLQQLVSYLMDVLARQCGAYPIAAESEGPVCQN